METLCQPNYAAGPLEDSCDLSTALSGVGKCNEHTVFGMCTMSHVHRGGLLETLEVKAFPKEQGDAC